MVRLSDIRAQKGLTQVQLGEAADVAEVTIIKLEAGDHVPHPDTLRKLASVLGPKVLEAEFGWRREPKRRGRPKAEKAEDTEKEEARSMVAATPTNEAGFAQWLQSLVRMAHRQGWTELPSMTEFTEAGPGYQQNQGMVISFPGGGQFEVSIAVADADLPVGEE